MGYLEPRLIRKPRLDEEEVDFDASMSVFWLGSEEQQVDDGRTLGSFAAVGSDVKFQVVIESEAKQTRMLKMVADINDGSLGLSFKSLPPGRVIVEKVVDGAFAGRHDANVNDELLSLNGA